MEIQTALKISTMLPADWPAVSSIYQEGIETGNATFEDHSPATFEEWSQGKLVECRLTAFMNYAVVGWAALSPVSRREIYRGVAEVSLYVAENSRGSGVGSELLRSIIQSSEDNGIWMLQAGVFPENAVSMHLCLKNGFKLLGIREKLGLMNFGPYAGQWRDVAFLERRSKIAGR